MLKLGLTGGMACGKSTVAAMLAARGAHLLDADAVVHELMRPGQRAYEAIVCRFGPGIVNSDSTINRAGLAEIVFAPQRVRIHELNEILHPAVLDYQERWMNEVEKRDPDGVAVVEAALILEAGARKQFDKILVVICRNEQKAERLAKRLAISVHDAAAEIERRSRVQMSDEQKASQADYVIDNSGSRAETEAEVEKFWQEWMRSTAP